MKHHDRGFSLTELLVALAVLAIVSALIIPRFLNVQDQAQAVVAQQMADELNKTSANWKTMGGFVAQGSVPPTADMLAILTSPPGVNAPAFPMVADAGESNEIRVSPIPDADLSAAGTSQSPTMVKAGGFDIFYNGSQFTVLPDKYLQQANWQSIGGVGVSSIYNPGSSPSELMAQGYTAFQVMNLQKSDPDQYMPIAYKISTMNPDYATGNGKGLFMDTGIVVSTHSAGTAYGYANSNGYLTRFDYHWSDTIICPTGSISYAKIQ